ncbi:arginase family protein [Microcella indica]|uniref:arginase family protein n=1 Tax=Microcella indica TaxID=2750620 RepID=UPI0015CF6612|nr:arginase family protein [Microcella indica]
MAARFLVVPQWQGSGSDRAMRLVEGAEAILADLPAGATERVEVPLEAGDHEGTGIHRWSSIRLVRERLGRALAEHEPPVIVVGGDCGVEYASIDAVAARARPVLLWADAHADLNSPETSPSGAFHGMVLRALLDDGVVAPEDVLLLGVRDLDDAEADAIERVGLRRVTADEVADAVAERASDGADALLYLHVDLDVLDPGVFAGVGFPAPFGLGLGELCDALRAARGALPLGGAGLCEYAPPEGARDDEAGDDSAAILRIIGAFTR